jgi:hypothetical protein
MPNAAAAITAIPSQGVRWAQAGDADWLDAVVLGAVVLGAAVLGAVVLGAAVLGAGGRCAPVVVFMGSA